MNTKEINIFNQAAPAATPDTAIDLTFERHGKLLEFSNDKDEKEKKAKVMLMDWGWTKNDVYVPKEVLAELVSLVPNKPKIYVDHDYFEFQGRSVKDWAATVLSCSTDNDGNIIADIDFTDNPNTIWLYKESRKNPDNVQFSTHITGYTSEYEADGRKGRKLEKILSYKSTDIVSYGATGGKTISVYNAVEDRLKKMEQYINNSQTKPKEETQMDIKTIQELRNAYPGLVAELESSIKDSTNQVQKVETLTNEVSTLKNTNTSLSAEKESLTKQVETLTNSLKAAETERDQLKVKVDEFETAKKIADWKAEVEAEIKNSEIDEKLVTETFKNHLLSQTKIETVKSLIEDRKALVSTSVIQNGVQKQENNSNPKPEASTILSDDYLASSFKQ